MTSKEKTIETHRERAKKDDDISYEDGEKLIEFSDKMRLLRSKYSHDRHEKLLGHCTRIAANVGGLAESLEDKEAAEEIVKWIHREYPNEHTNQDYRVALRVFGRRATDKNDDEPPESIDWVNSDTSNDFNPKPDPSEMLRWSEDVLPMIEAADYARDEAMIATAWDLGGRSGEFQSILLGKVTDHRHGLQITVDGKQGQRSVPLIPSVPHLQKWLSRHPGDDPDDPLWSKLNSPEGISYNMYKKVLTRAAEEAGVEKPVTLTNFRKSRASHLASQGMNQPQLEDRMGWVRGSDAAARYIAVFGREAENKFASIHGLEVEESSSDEIAPVECPRCGRETPREEDFCMWCNQALKQEAINRIKEDRDELRTAVLKLAKEKPDLLEDIENAQKMMSVLDENPELLESAKDFAEAMD